MEKSKSKSMQARRDRTGGIVRDKLDLLMDDMRMQASPPHLVELALELQSAIDKKKAAVETGS